MKCRFNFIPVPEVASPATVTATSETPPETTSETTPDTTSESMVESSVLRGGVEQ